jgi:hypothetical protein
MTYEYLNSHAYYTYYLQIQNPNPTISPGTSTPCVKGMYVN